MKKIKKNLFNRLSLNQKILTLIFIEIIAFISLMLVAFSQIYTVGSETKQMSSITIPLIESVHRIDDSVYSQRLSLNELYITVTQIVNQDGDKTSFYDKYVQLLGGKSIQDKFSLASQKLKESIADTEDFIRKVKNDEASNNDIIVDNQEQLLLELYELRVVSQKYNQIVVSNLFLENNLQILTLNIKNLNEILSTEESLVIQAEKVSKELENVINDSKEKIIYVERIAISYIVITTIISILFAISMILLIVRMNISKPLQLLTDSINRYTPLRKVTRLEDEQNILEREDELGRMGRSFNRLKEDLWEQGVGLQNAKEDADRANKAKSLFLASASHDLRQPLNAMQMYIAALKSKVKDEKILTIIEDINSVSASTARLLNALLDVSELEVGAIKPRYEDFSINNIFTSIFQSFAPLAKDKNLQFRIVPSSITVRSDPDLLERILGNYMSNAIRYTEAGSVMMGCRKRGNKVSIEVWDTGCGISEDQMPNIFEDFYQIENKERDRSKGLGLGLALAKRLSLSLSHTIDCKSTLGGGSCFSVLVEIGEAKNSEVQLEAISNIMDLTGARILLVEDDIDVLKASIQLMESWGCIVDSGRDLDEIKNIIRSPDYLLPNIIVADNRLPGDASGVDVVKLVQQELESVIPSIIITGDVERSHIQSIKEKGLPVLLKPIQPAKFRAILSHLINS
ncbi:ATP-binding protein [Candidatus Pseudothioglobus sp. Uisw_050_01]|uniref:ATP-binding response regulator n=1 Tax=Candidatus Pseudothioglobus sp. Uisw_050_01 TaxID=3230997 RepID=UPI003A8552BA